MNPNATLAAVLVLVAGLVAAPVAAATAPGGTVAYAQDETTTPTPDGNATSTPGGNATVTPGERLAGVVAVQEAELEGEVAERTYGLRVARANSSAARAGVVAEQLGDVERRLDELERREQRLRRARENGSITEGEFRARMARVAVETANARRMANATERTAAGLPADVLAESGVDVTAIRTLQDRAASLSGPETAEIARSIAGPDVGRSMAGEQRPDQVAEQVPDQAGPGAGGAGPGDNETDEGGPGAGDGSPGGPGAGDGAGGQAAPNGTDAAPNGTDEAPGP